MKSTVKTRNSHQKGKIQWYIFDILQDVRVDICTKDQLYKILVNSLGIHGLWPLDQYADKDILDCYILHTETKNNTLASSSSYTRARTHSFRPFYKDHEASACTQH